MVQEVLTELTNHNITPQGGHQWVGQRRSGSLFCRRGRPAQPPAWPTTPACSLRSSYSLILSKFHSLVLSWSTQFFLLNSSLELVSLESKGSCWSDILTNTVSHRLVEGSGDKNSSQWQHGKCTLLHRQVCISSRFPCLHFITLDWLCQLTNAINPSLQGENTENVDKTNEKRHHRCR